MQDPIKLIELSVRLQTCVWLTENNCDDHNNAIEISLFEAFQELSKQEKIDILNYLKLNIGIKLGKQSQRK